MIAERNDARNDQRGGSPPVRVRLAWRFKATGTMGRGPWMHRPEVVEAWVDSLNHRYRGDVEHWIEAEPSASP
jgi:hypothetical protein